MRILHIAKETAAVLGVLLLFGLVCLAPFACIYGARVAWTAGGLY